MAVFGHAEDALPEEKRKQEFDQCDDFPKSFLDKERIENAKGHRSQYD